MAAAPLREGEQEGPKGLAVRGQFVFGAQDGLMVEGALKNADLLQFAELLGQHLVRDLRDAALELTKTEPAALELVEDERFPLASDDAERGRDGTLREKHDGYFTTGAQGAVRT